MSHWKGKCHSWLCPSFMCDLEPLLKGTGSTSWHCGKKLQAGWPAQNPGWIKHLSVLQIVGEPLANVLCWTGKHWKPNFLVGRGLEIPIQTALNRCQIRMFAQNPLPNIYRYISYYQNPKQTKHKASNNRKQSRVYSHSPVRRYSWANLKHPCCQKGTILLPPYFPFAPVPSCLLLVSALELVWLNSERLNSLTQWKTDPAKYSFPQD